MWFCFNNNSILFDMAFLLKLFNKLIGGDLCFANKYVVGNYCSDAWEKAMYVYGIVSFYNIFGNLF